MSSYLIPVVDSGVYTWSTTNSSTRPVHSFQSLGLIVAPISDHSRGVFYAQVDSFNMLFPWRQTHFGSHGEMIDAAIAQHLPGETIITSDLTNSPGTRIYFARDEDGYIKGAILHEQGAFEVRVLTRWNPTDTQWDLASAEAYFHGGRYQNIPMDLDIIDFRNGPENNWSTNSLWTNSVAPAGATYARPTFQNIFGSSPDSFAPRYQEEFDVVSIVLRNLSNTVFGSEVRATSGYLLDRGYYFLLNGMFHAGIDFGAPTGTGVASPVTGHIIQKSGSGQDQFIVIRELSGERLWILGHIKTEALTVGQFVSAGQDITSLHDHSNGSHLHLQASRLESGSNIIISDTIIEQYFAENIPASEINYDGWVWGARFGMDLSPSNIIKERLKNLAC